MFVTIGAKIVMHKLQYKALLSKFLLKNTVKSYDVFK